MSCGCPLIGPCAHPGTPVCEVDMLRREHEQRHRGLQQIPVVTRLREQQQRQRTPTTEYDELAREAGE